MKCSLEHRAILSWIRFGSLSSPCTYRSKAARMSYWIDWNGDAQIFASLLQFQIEHDLKCACTIKPIYLNELNVAVKSVVKSDYRMFSNKKSFQFPEPSILSYSMRISPQHKKKVTPQKVSIAFVQEKPR